ncbi:MAG TPA: IS1182 family transposase [Acidimicrobiales bacterium]|nr:IS1182 family transposase [Acidimicrobiales bacterium]
MALGVAQAQARFESPRELLGERLREGSIYRLLADEGEHIFPEGYFADLYTASARGRPTVPARVLATAMVLQAFEGLSDREACDRLEVDLRWQAAAGVHTGAEAFHPTVLVGQRNRLRASGRPRRLFEDTKVVAMAAGVLANRARVLDSTPLYDAVATQDTVTQLRAAVRKLLMVLDNLHPELAGLVRGQLGRDDDYHQPGKPPCDWDDKAAREALVDALVHDALSALSALDGAELSLPAAEAAELLALVAGQDVAAGDDGRFRIVKKVAKDRTISTVDTEARHGHKSANRHFDGYKAHLSVDPESELIDEVAITPANAPDAQALAELLASHADDEAKPEVVGDSAYGSAAARSGLEAQGYSVTAKAAPVRNSTGGFSKEDFRIDLAVSAVTCPAGHTAPVRFGRGGEGKASFKGHCRHCPLKSQCTPSHRGRTISVHPQEAVLQRARAEQKSPEWQARYKATRPIVERKISHFTRRPWGGRKARSRGAQRATTDVLARAAALNWARLATLGLHYGPGSWALN